MSGFFRRGARDTAPEAPRGAAPEVPSDAGMVTAELAVALPALVLAALLAVTALQGVIAQMECLDAAGVAARLAGRGEATASVTAAVVATGPPGAEVQLQRVGELVHARVVAEVHPLGLANLIPGFAVDASAASLAEDVASPR